MDRNGDSTRSISTTLGRIIVSFGIALLTVVVGYILFFTLPSTGWELVAVVLILSIGILGLRFGSSIARRYFPYYNVAEISVEGPISRDGGSRRFPPTPGTTAADAIVEQIDAANEDDAVDGLLLKLNTPGGEVVPSDDIRSAVERFNGPTVAYATDVCGSGGYWIAAGCDHIIAREGSLVGSIGVNGSRVTADELSDKIGLTYERFAAGRFKDTGVPLRQIDDEERMYLQSLIDELYGQFIDRVSSSRDMSADAIRDTEAKIYLGTAALEIGLIDSIGTRDDAREQIAELLDRESVDVKIFEPPVGLAQRLRGGVELVSFAFGAGIASVLKPEGDSLPSLRL